MEITILNISERGNGFANIIFNSEHHQPHQSIVYPLTPEQVQQLIPGTKVEINLGLKPVIAAPRAIAPAHAPAHAKPKAEAKPVKNDGTKKVTGFNA